MSSDINSPFCEDCIYVDIDKDNICDACDEDLSNFESIRKEKE